MSFTNRPNRQNTTTHPTGSTLQQSLAAWREDLQDAVRSMMPARGLHGYSRVLVSLFCWERDSEGFEEELLGLEHVFQRIYNYETSVFRIPISSSDHTCSRHLAEYLHGIASTISENDLLIVYYAGHVIHNFDKSHMAPAAQRPCILRSQPGQSVPAGAMQTTRQCSVDFSEAAMHTVDEITQADVLYILDCCFSASFAIQSRRELLAACGIERVTPQPGFESFTRALTQSLEEINGAPITVAHLHGYLMSQYYDQVLSTTPIHVKFSERMQASGSIVLAALIRGSTKIPPHRQVTRQPIPRHVPNPPKVLLSITLSDRSDPPNADQWKAWLRSMSGGVSDVDIELTGFYKSSSSVMLVTLPISIWDCLKSHPAYVFLGIVQTGNLLRSAVPAQTTTGGSSQENDPNITSSRGGRGGRRFDQGGLQENDPNITSSRGGRGGGPFSHGGRELTERHPQPGGSESKQQVCNFILLLNTHDPIEMDGMHDKDRTYTRYHEYVVSDISTT